LRTFSWFFADILGDKVGPLCGRDIERVVEDEFRAGVFSGAAAPMLWTAEFEREFESEFESCDVDGEGPGDGAGDVDVEDEAEVMGDGGGDGSTFAFVLDCGVGDGGARDEDEFEKMRICFRRTILLCSLFKCSSHK